MTDVIVVGSGPGGLHAASRLVEAGLRVLLLDFGNRDERYAPLIPRRAVLRPPALRSRAAPLPARRRFEGIPFGPVRVGAQLTPPRMHILADAAERQPVDAPGFAASMSLARGGLGAGWSAGVFPFSDDELDGMGFGVADLQPHYDTVAERIGVAGNHDDLERFLPPSPSMMPALELDSNAEVVSARYRARADRAERARVLSRPDAAGRVHAAASRARAVRLSRPRLLGRYRPSVYRPQWTLDELLPAPGFTYLARRLVRRFTEQDGRVLVEAEDADSGAVEQHEARALVIAAGTFATARIVLRSLDRYDTAVPFVCNEYAYVPTLNLGMLGHAARDRRASLAQLTAMVRWSSPAGASSRRSSSRIDRSSPSSS